MEHERLISILRQNIETAINGKLMIWKSYMKNKVFIEQMIAALYSSQQLANCGINEVEIKKSEKKLNLIFPEVLRNYYLKFGNSQILNYHDELFRIQDIFIDSFHNEDYVVFCKEKGRNKFYGIKTAEVRQKNPLVYTKSSERLKDDKGHNFSFVWHESPKSHDTLEKFLLYFSIENTFEEGLAYRFSLHDAHDVEKVTMLINNGTIPMQKITDISQATTDGKVYSNYYMDNHSAMHILYISEKNDNKMGYLYFASGDAIAYKNTMAILNGNGIKPEKRDDPVNDYKIYKRLSATIGSIIVPGGYDNWRERHKDAILVPEKTVNKIYDLLLKANANFDYYGISTEYSKEQINYLVALLKNRVEEMTDNENFMFLPIKKIMDYNDFYYSDNIDYRRYKNYIITVLEELITWLEAVTDEKIQIIGV
ncbi:hypothetical protein FACS189450_04840 [Spirochaetia bacterium]|nr:hypothetical protein FACS189450_04840 [Spirochaetia bacterium]GHU95926.1 hypothetical protein FACS189479_09620 [Spirochaetia bacterium]